MIELRDVCTLPKMDSLGLLCQHVAQGSQVDKCTDVLTYTYSSSPICLMYLSATNFKQGGHSETLSIPPHVHAR